MKPILEEMRNKKDMTYRKKLEKWQKQLFPISSHIKNKWMKLVS